MKITTHAIKLVLAAFLMVSTISCGGGDSGANTEPNAQFSISGAVYGLDAGKQVTILNNGSDAITISAGSDISFKFSKPVALHGSYAITVGKQPIEQICTVSNGSGSNVTATVINVNVSCARICTTTLAGIIKADTQYGVSGSPYCINKLFQIPSGVSATFDAGTSISGGIITVQGTLNINGTTTNKVNLSNVMIDPAGLQDIFHHINISGANISGGSLYAATGDIGYGSLTLTDSTITGAPYIYLWYPRGTNLIARNRFIATGGISFGLDFRGSQTPPSLIIRNNYFSGWTTHYAIENWAQYGTGTALIEKNTFNVISDYVAYLPSGYTDAALNLSNNYWGTTNTATIDSYIYDKNDNVSSAGTVTYLPLLNAPDIDTPTN